MPYATLQFKGQSNPVPKQAPTPEIEEFNLVMGAPFTCGVCGHRHKSVSANPAQRCFDKIYEEVNLSDRPKSKSLVFFVSKQRTGDEWWHIDIRSNQIDYLTDIDKAIYGLDKIIRNFESKTAYTIKIPFPKLYPLLLPKTKEDRLKKFPEICEKNAGKAIENYNSELVKLNRKIAFRTHNAPKNISITEPDPERGFIRINKDNGTYISNLVSWSINEIRSPVEHFWDYEQRSLYFLLKEKNENEYAVLTRHQINHKYAPIILPYNIKIDESIKLAQDRKWITL